MGRMDGDGNGVEIADPRGRIAQLELEVQRLERLNDQLQTGCDRLERINASVVQSNHELAAEIERLRTEAELNRHVVGRGYHSVTVYADGTVEVDRSFGNDGEPASQRTL